MGAVPDGWRPSYLDQLSDLPAKSIELITANDEQGKSISDKRAKMLDKQLKAICQEIRAARSKWEARFGEAPDLPPYGLL